MTKPIFAVKAFGIAVLVLGGALFSACGNGAVSPTDQVAGTRTVNPASASATSAITGAAASGAPGARRGRTFVPATTAASAMSAEVIQVNKCYTNATRSRGGEMLIKANSSQREARLFAYRPDGTLIGELHNGGGNSYGGSVMPYQQYDPLKVVIKSSAGGSITVRTTPFQPDN